MRTFLVAFFALLLFGGVAQAGTGLPVMLEGIEGPKANLMFADRIDAALAQDETGKAAIKGGTGGYSPLEVYRSLREFHPELAFKADPTMADFKVMTEYIRSLKLEPLAVAGTYRNSRKIRNGSAYALDLSWTRDLPKGQMVWVDRNTGVPVLKANCGNVLGPIAPPVPCAYALLKVKSVDAFVSAGAFGAVTAEEEADCPITVQGPGTGPDGRTFKPNGYGPLVDSKDHPCDWALVKAELKLPVYKTGCIKVAPGWYVVKVPLSFALRMDRRLVFCLTKADGTTTLGMGVLPQEYHPASDGSKIATIWYGENFVPANYQGRTILWWRPAPARGASLQVATR